MTVRLFAGEWGKQYDTNSHLILMGARPYDPSVGRFLEVDPVDGGSLNNYDYAGQDPINGYDLGGTMEMKEDTGGTCIAVACGFGTQIQTASFSTIVKRLTGVSPKTILRVAINVGTATLIASCTAATAGVCAGAVVPLLFAVAAGSGAGVADYYLSPGKKTAKGVAQASIQGALLDPGGYGFALSGLFKMSLPEAERTFTAILLRAFGAGK